MKRYFKSFILVALILVLTVLILKRVFPIKYEQQIDISCEEYGVDKSLALAVIKAESNFNENAVSHADAIGLMQLTEETALWCGQQMGINLTTEDIKNPETNIKLGIWYLSYLINKTSSEEIAIISYNAGINKVSEWISSDIIDEQNLNFEKIPYQETKNYIKKVLLFKRIYSILYNITP